MHINTVGATSTTIMNSCNQNALDVWYKFTATSAKMKVKGLEFTDYGNSIMIYEIYTDACATSNRLGDSCYGLDFNCEGCENIFEEFTIGEEYYLRVWLIQGQEADICIESLCDIAITTHSVSTCDNGDNTYDLTVEVAASGLEIGDSLVLFVENGGGDADNGLKIVNSNASFTFNVTGIPATGNAVSFSISEWNGGCYQYFQDYYTAPSPCVPAPINDNCVNATPVTDFESCTLVHVNTQGATLEPVSNNCSATADVWYTFVAPSSRISLETVDISSYGTTSFSFDIYEAGCTAITPNVFDCLGTCEGCEVEINGLIVGETYNLRIWLSGGTEADFCIEGICDIDILSHTISTCDNGDNTYDLTVEVAASGLAVGDYLALYIVGLAGEPTKLEIVNSSANFIFNVFDLPSIGNMVSFSIEELSGDCDSYFQDYYTAPSPCVPAPINDNCVNATPVTDFESCTLVHVNTQGATLEPVSNNCSTTADVWYTFVAPSSRISLETVDISSYGTTSFSFDIYEAGCTAITPNVFDCLGTCEGCEVEINGLIVGETYNLRIWLSGGTEADFCIEGICDIDILSHTISTCDNGDNTYDLDLEVIGEGLPIGEPLTINVEGNTFSQTITSSVDTFDVNFLGLIADGLPVSIPIHAGFGVCDRYFPQFYTAPGPCVPGPQNDSCHQALLITEFLNCDPIHINLTSATATPKEISCSNGTDSWYKFTASSTRYQLTAIDLQSYNTNFLRFEVFSTDCDTSPSELIYCNMVCNTCSQDFDGLEIGKEYFIRILLLRGLEADFCLRELCDFEIVSINTTTCNPIDNSYNLTLEITASEVEIGDELVFATPSRQEKIIVSSIESSYTFQINGLTALGNAVSFDLHNNGCSEYFHEAFVAPPYCGDPPANNDCVDAIEILDLAACNTLHINLLGADSEDINFGCDQNAGDVWYKFTANVPKIEFLNLDFSTYGTTYLLAEFYEAPCSNLNRNTDCFYLCEGECDFTVNDLTIGAEYYIRFWNDSNNNFEADVCIQASNGNICNDVPLNLNQDVINQATYQTAHSITAEGMITNNQSTNLIAQEVITLMPGFHAEAGATFTAFIENCTPNSSLIEEENSIAQTRQSENLAVQLPIKTVNDLKLTPNPFYESTTIKYKYMSLNNRCF